MGTENAPGFLGLQTYLRQMGEVGTRLAELRACEGTAGNISIGLGWDVDPLPFFPSLRRFELPECFPELAGKSIVISGSGCRLRDIATEPTGNLGFLKIRSGGDSADLYTDPSCHFTQLTSELLSHLVLHQRTFSDPSKRFNAVVHAQPMHLTYLTHMRRYQDGGRLCHAVLRWQSELTVIFPLGFGYVPYYVPNSDELMQATRAVNPAHSLLVWEKHGVISVSDQDIYKAYDLVEYVETGARYEYMNLLNNEAAEGLLDSDIEAIRRHFNLPGPTNDAGR